MIQESEDQYREVYYNAVRTDGLKEGRHTTLPHEMPEQDAIFFIINANDNIAYYNEFLVL